jgi:hypothetical protein
MWNLIFATVGGLAINFLRYVEVMRKTKDEEKEFSKTKLYWIQFLITPIIGGIIAAAYGASGINMTPILAIQIGASAPLILKSLASATPSIGVEQAA